MRRLAAAAVAATFALGACGSDSDKASEPDAGGSDTTAAASGGGAAEGTAIVIKNFKFEPQALKAKVGDTITVTNKDSAVHTLTAKDKSVDTKELAQDASGTITLEKAGTIDYICEIHQNMTGTIEVQG